MSHERFSSSVSRSTAVAILLLALLSAMPAAAEPAAHGSNPVAGTSSNLAWATALRPAPRNSTASVGAADPIVTPDHSHGEMPEAYTLPDGAFNVTGPQKIVVLRVRFSDYSTATRYTQAQAQSFFDSDINTMWGRISYGTISINATVSALLNLPHPRSNYITDHSDGDLSEGGQFIGVLNDAVAAAHTAGIDFTGVKDVMVVMGETDAS